MKRHPLERIVSATGGEAMYGEYEQVNGAVANALQAEVDALRKDAERYRHLRATALEVSWCVQVSFSPGYSANGPAELDAEVDRQMQGANT